MKILFLSGWLPYPITNGSKLRIYHLLRGLARFHDIYLISFTDPGASIEIGLSELEKYCRDIQVIPWKEYQPTSLRALAGWFSIKPRSVIDTFSSEMYRMIANEVRRIEPDIIIASQATMASYWRAFRGTPAIFEELEVGMLANRIKEESSPFLRLRYSLTPLKQRYYLRGLVRHFRSCTLVSDPELAAAKRLVPDYPNFTIIPNCVDLSQYQDVNREPQSNRLIFTGSFRYSANYQAITWFLDEIYPIIVKEIPQVELFITGDHADLALPPASNVTLTGFVEDIRPYIAGATVSIVPLRYGGGTRLKILEAMALGTPVVSTPKGAEGLDVLDGVHLSLADKPDDFARAVVKMLRNYDLAQQLSADARRLVEEKYNWSTVMPSFLALVDRCTGIPVVVSK